MESTYLEEKYDKNDSFYKTKTSLQSNGTIQSNNDKESGTISEVTAEVNVAKMNGTSDEEEFSRQLPLTLTASDKAGKLRSPSFSPAPESYDGGHTLQRLEPEGSDAPTESGPGVKGESNRAQHETVEHYEESHRPEDAPSKQSTRVSLVATVRETLPPTENKRMSDGSDQNTGTTTTTPSRDSTTVEQENQAIMTPLTSKQRPPSRTSYNVLDTQSEEQGPEGDAQSVVQVEISPPKPIGENQESVQHTEKSKIDSPNALVVPENRTRTSPEGLDHSSDEKGNGGKDRPSGDEINPYFTGRLPTLLLREQTIQPANEKFAPGRANQDSVRELNTAKGKSQETRREQTSADKDDRDALTYSPTNKQDTQTPMTEHDTKNVTNATPSSNNSAIPMSSREVQDILKEIKSDSHEYALIKEKPLTPRDNKEKEGTALSVIQSVAEENGVNLDAEENRRGEYEGSRMTLGDIDAVTSKVVGTTHVKDRQSYFDNLPQVKNIDSYVAANKLPRENSEVREVTTNERSKETHDVNQYERNTPDTTENTEGRTKTKTPDSHGSTAGRSDYRKDMIPQIEKSTQLAEVDEKPPLRDSEEVALRDIIASAKRAIDQGHESEVETDDTLTELATTDASRISVHGSHVAQVERVSRGGRQDRRESEVSTTVDEGALICSNCMRADSNVHSSGFCGVCKKYLCSTCITVHTMDSKTSHHEILACYCKNELGINKYVKATAYCSDCVAFLCSKCSLDHVGKRIYKRHRVIQSSFVMKPHNKKTSSMQFLNNIQDHFEHELAKRTSRSDKSRKEKQRKSMIEKQRLNPYKVAYSNVLPSLYPGPNKALGASYANNPKWPQASIPSLPYLVQPGPLRQRLLDNPYITQHRPLGYAGGKEIHDTLQDVKLKQMKSRYGVREMAQVFKLQGGSRPISRLSMTPAGTMKSFTTHGRTEGGVTVNIYPEPTLMFAEYLNEKNLSIPFPSGEKYVEISAMVILMNGHLVVFDKNNNNIKIYNKTFRCKAALQFHNRIVDIAASNLCPTDVYAATPRHMYEISSIKGLELTKKFNADVRRIEGLACWKYGLVVISKQTEITWELRLFDYRGNVKSKLEVLNPFTSDIAANKLYHVTTSRGGKYLSISDAQNGCVITIDLLGRKIAAETNLKQSSNDAVLEESQEETDASSNTADNKNVDVTPTYLTSDSNDNVYVSCDGRVLQVSRRGDLVGTVIDVPGEGRSNGSIVFNRSKKRLYVQTGPDSIIVYKIHA